MERLHCIHRENNGSPDGQNHPGKSPAVMTTRSRQPSVGIAVALFSERCMELFANCVKDPPLTRPGSWGLVWFKSMTRPHRHTYTRASRWTQTQLIRSSLGAFSTSEAGPQFLGHTSRRCCSQCEDGALHVFGRHTCIMGALIDIASMPNFGFKFGKPTTSDPRGHCLGPKGCTSRIYHIETLYLEGCSWSKVDLFQQSFWAIRFLALKRRKPKIFQQKWVPVGQDMTPLKEALSPYCWFFSEILGICSGKYKLSNTLGNSYIPFKASCDNEHSSP